METEQRFCATSVCKQRCTNLRGHKKTGDYTRVPFQSIFLNSYELHFQDGTEHGRRCLRDAKNRGSGCPGRLPAFAQRTRFGTLWFCVLGFTLRYGGSGYRCGGVALAPYVARSRSLASRPASPPRADRGPRSTISATG